jgi:hypothetical protein
MTGDEAIRATLLCDRPQILPICRNERPRLRRRVKSRGVASTHGLVHCASSQEWRRVVQPPAPPVSSERLRPERRCRRETPWENRSHEAASAVINSTNAVNLCYPAPNRLVSWKAPRIPASTTHEIADRDAMSATSARCGRGAVMATVRKTARRRLSWCPPMCAGIGNRRSGPYVARRTG